MPALQQMRSNACVCCGRPADAYCARCGITPYCSQACQASDWSDRHKAVCHNLARFGDQTDGPYAAAEAAASTPAPAPLRRPHAVTEQKRDRPQKRDDDSGTLVSDKGDKLRRLQDRSNQQLNRSSNQDRASNGCNENDSNGRDVQGSGQTGPSGREAQGSGPSGRETQGSGPSGREAQGSGPSGREAQSPGLSGIGGGRSYRNNYIQSQTSNNRNFGQRNNKPQPADENLDTYEAKPVKEVKQPVKVNIPVKTNPVATVKPKIESSQDSVTAPVTKPSQMNSTNVTSSMKPASVDDVTPMKKSTPTNYLIEQLTIGDSVLLSVDAKASACRSKVGDYVCLCMHEKYEADYQTLVETYTVDCDADTVPHKLVPGEVCSYFNEEDSGWYRARCLNPSTIALIDGSKVIAIKQTDKIRRLTGKYEQIPEFCCVLECSNVEVGANLLASILSKSGDKYKVNLDNVETGSSVGEGVLSRWTPTVEYAKVPPVIPEVPRPTITSNSRVILVDATGLDRAFVRPAAPQKQTDYDDVVQNALLAGRKGSPLKEAPVRGQTVIAKFTDGLHYRALCKRTNVAQNKYLLEYIDFGNIEVCLTLDNLYPCPSALDISTAPTQVSMIKICADAGELTPVAKEYVEKLKDNCEEIILTLPNGESSAPSGSEAILKLVKNGEMVNKKIVEMCTPDWKKFENNGGDVVDLESLMYSDLEYDDLPPGPVEFEILDADSLDIGLLSGCLKGNPNMEHVFTHVTQKMADYCNSELGKQPYLPKLEELCIAKYPPYPQWFRAILTKQTSGAGGDTASVLYIDYGTVAPVSVSLLRKMLPEFVRGIPAVGIHLEIKDFPRKPSEDMLLRAAAYLKMNAEGRGTLRIDSWVKQEDGLYTVVVPGLIAAMKR